jgi:N-acyl-D-aspartate/D-glutamate deacylase
MVLGDADVQPTAEQLEKMKALVRDAMHEGAVGVSTSLEYAPRSLREDGRNNRARQRGGEIWRYLRDSYA